MEMTTICNDNGSSNINKVPEDLISALPKECLERVMELMPPRDAMRAAAVCTAFHSVVESDDFWVHFLPADLSSILSHADSDVHQQLPLKRKELYCYLSYNWISLDGGLKSLSLDFSTGMKKILLHEESLGIIDSRYTILPVLFVCGKFNLKDLSPETNYGVYLVFTGTLHSEGPQVHHEFQNDDEDVVVSNLFQLARSLVKLVEYVCKYQPNGCIGFIYREGSKALWQESQRRQDGRWEMKFGKFNSSLVWDEHLTVFFSDEKMQCRDLIVEALEVRPEIIDVIN